MTPDDDRATTVKPWSAPSGAFQRRAVIIAITLLVAAGLYTLKDFLPALVWALVFAIALWPLRDRLRTRFPGRAGQWVPLGLVSGVLLVFVIPVAVVSVPLAEDAHASAEWVKRARQSGVPPPAALASLPGGNALSQSWQRTLGQPGGVSQLASKAAHGSLAGLARTAAQQVAHRLVLVGFMLLTLFFLLRDGDDVVREVRSVSRRIWGDAGEAIGEQMVRSVRGTVDGLVFVGLGEGVVLGIAYAIAGVPHPTLFGLITALLAMIPFGAAVAIFVSAAVLLLSGSATGAVILVVFGLVLTFVADHFIRPALIGGATRLPFLWVLLGILGGVEAWGLVGLFVGPAIMAALMLIWQRVAAANIAPHAPIAENSPPD